MEKRFIDISHKFAQYDDIEYAPDYVCPECGESGFLQNGTKVPKSEPRILGWCETNLGHRMGVFECPYCGKKYRFHGGDLCDDEDTFDYKIVQYFGRRCINWDCDFSEKLGTKHPLKSIKVEM